MATRCCSPPESSIGRDRPGDPDHPRTTHVLGNRRLAGWVLGRSLSRKRSPEPRDRAPDLGADVTTPAVVPAAPLVRVPAPAVFEGAPVDSAGDFMEPLAFLLAKYVKFPVLGYPMLDEVVGNLRVTSRGTAEEAVERAANLVRYGDRGQLVILLGGAAVAGWLLARQSPDERLPAG